MTGFRRVRISTWSFFEEYGLRRGLFLKSTDIGYSLEIEKFGHGKYGNQKYGNRKGRQSNRTDMYVAGFRKIRMSTIARILATVLCLKKL